MLVSALRDEVASHLSDPAKQQVTDTAYIGFINSAARDARNKGILIHVEDAETIILVTDVYKYALVPQDMAYVHQIRISNDDFTVTDTEATGITLSANVADTTTPTISISGVTDLAVNQVIIINTEAMLITAFDIVSSPNTATVTRGYYGTTAATHTSGDALNRSNVAIEFNDVIAPVYWGGNFNLTHEGARIEFNTSIFPIDEGRILSFTGQKRASEYALETDTVDAGLESFLRERTKYYAANSMVAGGSQLSQHRSRVAAQAFELSEDFLTAHPKEFRQRPRSIYVPGR